jgi:hypothetical protein
MPDAQPFGWAGQSLAVGRCFWLDVFKAPIRAPLYKKEPNEHEYPNQPFKQCQTQEK